MNSIGWNEPLPPGRGRGIAMGFKDSGGVNKPAQAAAPETDEKSTEAATEQADGKDDPEINPIFESYL